MNKKLTIGVIVIVGIILVYIGLREIFWIVRDTTNIDDNLTVKIAFDRQFFGWLDPTTDKKLEVTNQQTGATLNLEVKSIERNLYFFVDNVSTGQVLKITDQYLGQNQYDYSTLKLLPGQKDCFDPNNYCGGYNKDGLAELGKPLLTYDHEGFKK